MDKEFLRTLLEDATKLDSLLVGLFQAFDCGHKGLLAPAELGHLLQKLCEDSDNAIPSTVQVRDLLKEFGDCEGLEYTGLRRLVQKALESSLYS